MSNDAESPAPTYQRLLVSPGSKFFAVVVGGIALWGLVTAGLAASVGWPLQRALAETFLPVFDELATWWLLFVLLGVGWFGKRVLHLRRGDFA